MSGMEIEGDPTKRYRLSYRGEFLGSYDVADDPTDFFFDGWEYPHEPMISYLSSDDPKPRGS